MDRREEKGEGSQKQVDEEEKFIKKRPPGGNDNEHMDTSKTVDSEFNLEPVKL